MKPLSKDKKIENTILAAMLWHDVSPQGVALDTWSCGTHACFGGYVASWPEFAAQGVRRFNYSSESCHFDGKPGVPCIKGRSDVAAFEWNVAGHLFGDNDLFNSRQLHTPLNGDVDIYALNARGKYKISDHKLVAIRLENQFAELTR